MAPAMISWAGCTCPAITTRKSLPASKEAAKKIREDSEVLVVAGIGGSYLGARAVIEAVKGLYHNELEDGPQDLLLRQQHQPQLSE